MEKLFSVKKKLVCLLFAVITSLTPLAAVDAYVSNLYKEIDVAFVSRSENALSRILEQNSASSNYYLLENYAMKKIRHLVLEEEYDFALKACLIVIDNDLEYDAAIDMYSAIAVEYEKQQKKRQDEATRIIAERQKLEDEKERKKVEANKDFTAVLTPDGNTVYVVNKEKQIYSEHYWNVKFGFDFAWIFENAYRNSYADEFRIYQDTARTKLSGLLSDNPENFSSWKPGLAMDITYEYSFDKLMLGLDLNGEINIPPFVYENVTSITRDSAILQELELVKTGNSQYSSVEDIYASWARYKYAQANEGFFVNGLAVAKLGFISRQKTFYVRGGFGAIHALSHNYSVLTNKLNTPLVGVGMNRIQFGSLTFTGNVDVYLQPLWDSSTGTYFGMGGEFNLSIPISYMEKARMTFNVGLKDAMFLKGTGFDNPSGIENRARLVLSIGAENVAK